MKYIDVYHFFDDFYDFDQEMCHFFTNSQKFGLLKYMSNQNLQYLILKLLTKNFRLSTFNIALGLRDLGLEDKVCMHFVFNQNLCIYTVSTFRGSKKGSFRFLHARRSQGHV